MGSFRNLCKIIGNRNITELGTRYSDPQNARVLVGIKVEDKKDISELMADLKKEGFKVQDLGDNELVKLHLRHMVGGNSPDITHERLMRFQFPERPGALLNFMDAMKVEFNITLFQYRYHGADFGRVLLGFDVPPEKEKDFTEFLQRVENMGYVYRDETANEAYAMFLGWHGKGN